jgi:hypothetical protein
MESIKQPVSTESYYTDALLNRSARVERCQLNWQLYAASCRGRSTRDGFRPCDNPDACGVENRTKHNEDSSDLYQGLL